MNVIKSDHTNMCQQPQYKGPKKLYKGYIYSMPSRSSGEVLVTLQGMY